MDKNANLKKYLKDLAQDAAKRKGHLADPVGTMTKEGVDAAHQEMIMNGDLDGIKKAVGEKDTLMILAVASYKK